jgi:hypothetical protein
VKIFHAKLPKDNIYKQGMEVLPKAKTVLEWIANFKQVRETGRQRLLNRNYNMAKSISIRNQVERHKYKMKSIRKISAYQREYRK